LREAAILPYNQLNSTTGSMSPKGVGLTADEGGPQLECTFCHENADKSSHATIPNVTTCMACHQTTKTDSPEVQKLTAIADRNEQPRWKRVYWMEKED
jgi:hypothetical protein